MLDRSSRPPKVEVAGAGGPCTPSAEGSSVAPFPCRGRAGFPFPAPNLCLPHLALAPQPLLPVALLPVPMDAVIASVFCHLPSLMVNFADVGPQYVGPARAPQH